MMGRQRPEATGSSVRKGYWREKYEDAEQHVGVRSQTLGAGQHSQVALQINRLFFRHPVPLLPMHTLPISYLINEFISFMASIPF